MLRYGDFSIFKMAAVRHLGIVMQVWITHEEYLMHGRSQDFSTGVRPCPRGCAPLGEGELGPHLTQCRLG